MPASYFKLLLSTGILFLVGLFILIDITPYKLAKSANKLFDTIYQKALERQNKTQNIQQWVQNKSIRHLHISIDETSETKELVRRIVVVLLFAFTSLMFANKGWLIIPVIYLVFTVPFAVRDIVKKNNTMKRIVQMELMMNAITSSYMRTKSIIRAFEECGPSLEGDFKELAEFFVFNCININPDIETNLEDLAERVNHFVFTEWTTALIRCQHDASFAITLDPIVAKVSSIRKMQNEMDVVLSSATASVLTLDAMYLALFPLFYTFDKAWIDLLFNTQGGNFVLAMSLTLVLFSTRKAIEKINKMDYQNVMKGADA